MDTQELVDIQVAVEDNQAVAGLLEEILGVAAVVHRGLEDIPGDRDENGNC